MTDRFSAAALPRLPQSVARPAYDRRAVTPGIVHLGVGAFHRAHQAVFIDDCLNRGETQWGIVAASLRSPETRDAIEPQDNLYTFCLRDGKSERLRIIGSIMETIVAPENPERLVDRMSDPRVLIVTLTVTEKGYVTNLASRSLLRDHPDIVHDLENPDRPRSIFGFILAATRRRRKEGSLPLTLLSCDNLPANGHVLRKLLLEFAALADPELAPFIEANIACPCSMVDRIVPATTDADRDAISAALGVRDAWPVVAEPYFRFVIEDNFPHGRPALERSGVEFVSNVEPYEHMKLRMLNGSHSAIAAIGQIAGLTTVADAWGEKTVCDFIDAYWREVDRTLDPAVDGAEFAAGLRERFANPRCSTRPCRSLPMPRRRCRCVFLAPCANCWKKRPPVAPLFLPSLYGSDPAQTGMKGSADHHTRPRFQGMGCAGPAGNGAGCCRGPVPHLQAHIRR